MFNGSMQLWCATALFTILYSGYGISVGYHRLHAHHSFKTWEPIRKLLLYLGCQGAQGSIRDVDITTQQESPCTHRQRRRCTHQLKDCFMLSLVGYSQKENHEFARMELFKIKKSLDPSGNPVPKNYVLLILLNLMLITLFTVWWFDGRYILASLNASFLSVIISGIVNVFGHLPIKGLTYETDPMSNNSTNNPWLVFLTWGESLHNNQHYKPRRLNFNTKWYELDIGRWMIATIKKS